MVHISSFILKAVLCEFCALVKCIIISAVRRQCDIARLPSWHLYCTKTKAVCLCQLLAVLLMCCL